MDADRYSRDSSQNLVAKLVICLLVTLCCFAPALRAQTTEQPGSSQSSADSAFYSRLNGWSVFGEYGPPPNFTLIGTVQRRTLITFGGEYTRRLLLSGATELDYAVQVRPFVLESDAVLAGYRSATTGQILVTFPNPQRVVLTPTTPIFLPPFGSVVPIYGHQWTYAGGANPIGFRLKFLPRKRVQPFVSSLAGFVYATRQIPIPNTSAFNFCFQFGGGIEYFLSRSRSVRVGYSYHHISNAYTGEFNPGVDSGLIQIGYSFGH